MNDLAHRLAALLERVPVDALAPGREALDEARELAADASRSADLSIQASALALEVRIARALGAQARVLASCGELLALLPALGPALRDGDEQLEQALVWALKYGAGAALDIPETPLATAEELITALEGLLARYRREPFAAWELRARLAHVRGDGVAVQELAARIRPVLSRRNHVEHHSDCPACTVVALADYVDSATPPAGLEPLLRPLLAEVPTLPGEPPGSGAVYDMLGIPAACANARMMAPARLARAYARAGRREEAVAAMDEALAAMGDAIGDRKLRVWVAALEVGAARAPDLATHAAELAALARDCEDAALALDAHVVAVRALAGIAPELRERLRSDALTLASRLDARLERPRHARETESMTS
jgi:hypothetical protein